jgi:hypothetical protein
MTATLHERIYRDLEPVQDAAITICGAGALGANLAETLARMGYRALNVIDRDRIEEHNLSTQPWTQQDIGAAKVKVLATHLYRSVGARLVAQHAELTTANAVSLLHGAGLVVDCFDNVPSRSAVARARKPTLHLALAENGVYGCGLWDDAYLLPDRRGGEADDGCDYPLTRPLALLVVAAGAEAITRFLLYGARTNFEITLDDLRMTARID